MKNIIAAGAAAVFFFVLTAGVKAQTPTPTNSLLTGPSSATGSTGLISPMGTTSATGTTGADSNLPAGAPNTGFGH